MQNKDKFENWLHDLYKKGKNSAFTYYKNQEHRYHKDNYPNVLSVIYGVDWAKASTNLLPDQFKTPLEFGTYLLSEWVYQLRKWKLTGQIPSQFLEALYQVEEEPLLTKKTPAELYSAVVTKVAENRKVKEAEVAEVNRKLQEKIAHEEYEAECAKLIREEETAKAAAAILEAYKPKGKRKISWEQKLVRLYTIATPEELAKAGALLKEEQTKRANKAKAEAERKAKAAAKKKAIEEARRKKAEEKKQAKIAQLEAQKKALEKELAKLKR